MKDADRIILEIEAARDYAEAREIAARGHVADLQLMLPGELAKAVTARAMVDLEIRAAESAWDLARRAALHADDTARLECALTATRDAAWQAAQAGPAAQAEYQRIKENRI